VLLKDSGVIRTRRHDAATIEQVIAGVPGKPRYYVLDGRELERLLRKKPSIYPIMDRISVEAIAYRSQCCQNQGWTCGQFDTAR
jgi:hypothetical protein